MRFDMRPYPVNMEKRVHRTFLLFPKRIGNEMRWLEFVKIRRQFHMGFSYCFWTDLEWVD